MAASARRLPLLRISTVVFPHQPLSVRYRGAAFNGPLAVPSGLLKRSHEEFDGRCLILGPCSRVGVEAQISPPIPHDAYSAAAYSAPGHAPSTPRGIAHLVGGQRLRLLRAKSERSWQLASVESFGELQPTAARRMRMDDEAERALELAVQGEAIGAFELALCTLDEVFDVFFSHSTHFSHMSEPILPISHLSILFFWRIEAVTSPARSPAAQICIHSGRSSRPRRRLLPSSRTGLPHVCR